jgi:hypothetical protein
MDAPLIAIPDGACRRRIDACQYHRVRRGITRHPRGGLVPRRLAGRPGLLRRRAAPGRVPEHRHTASQVRGGRPRRCHGVGRRRGTPRAPATRARSHHLPGGRLAAADSPSAEAEHGAAGPTRGVVARPPAAHGQRVARFTAQSPATRARAAGTVVEPPLLDWSHALLGPISRGIISRGSRVAPLPVRSRHHNPERVQNRPPLAEQRLVLNKAGRCAFRDVQGRARLSVAGCGRVAPGFPFSHGRVPRNRCRARGQWATSLAARTKTSQIMHRRLKLYSARPTASPYMPGGMWMLRGKACPLISAG